MKSFIDYAQLFKVQGGGRRPPHRARFRISTKPAFAACPLVPSPALACACPCGPLYNVPCFAHTLACASSCMAGVGVLEVNGAAVGAHRPPRLGGQGHVHAVPAADRAERRPLDPVALLRHGLDAGQEVQGHPAGQRSTAKVAFLATAYRATTVSSDCVRRPKAALRTHQEGPGSSDHRWKRWLFSQRPPNLTFSPRLTIQATRGSASCTPTSSGSPPSAASRRRS